MQRCHILLTRPQAFHALSSLSDAAEQLPEVRPLTLLVLELQEAYESIAGQFFDHLPEA